MANTFNMNKIYKWVRVAGIVIPAATTIMREDWTPTQKGRQLQIDYLGFNPDDGSFEWGRLKRGWLPGIAAIVITAVIPKIGSFIRGFLK